MATYQITQPDGATYEITEPDAPGLQQTGQGLILPRERAGILPLLARPTPTRQELVEIGATTAGQAVGQATPAGPLGGAAGAMTAFALQRKVQTGKWPSWRELGLQGTMALAVPMVGGMVRGVQTGLRISPPGRMVGRQQALEAFEASRAAGETTIQGVQAETTVEVQQLQRMAAQTQAIRRDYTAHAKDALQREVTASRLKVEGLREAGVQTGRDFVARLPVLTEEEIAGLYAKTAQHQFTMPTTLLRQAQGEIAKDVSLVQKFFPQAGMGERARLAAGAPQATPSAQLELLPVPAEQMTFQEAHGLLKWLGQRIGSLQRATTPDAGEQLGAAKLLYSKVQQSLEQAAESGAIPAQARADLRAANLAYKQRATVEALGDAIESAIATNAKGQITINPGRLLDTLRKGKQGTFLADRLREVGLLDQVEKTFGDIAAGIRQEAARIPAVRERFAAQALEIIPPLKEQEAAMRAAAQHIQARGQAQIADIRGGLQVQEAGIPPTVRPPSMEGILGAGGFSSGMTLLITGGHYGQAGAIGALAAAPFVLARLLMTGPGQTLVRRMVTANAGVLDEPMLQLLASTVLRAETTSSTAAPKQP